MKLPPDASPEACWNAETNDLSLPDLCDISLNLYHISYLVVKYIYGTIYIYMYYACQKNCGDVFDVVFLWWCGSVFMFLWWCFCGGVVVFLCFCGGVLVVFLWCFCGGVLGVLFLWWCFCGGVVVFLWSTSTTSTTTRPEDQRTRGQEDQGTGGPGDQRTKKK